MTDWSAGMVVVSKANGDTHICIDFRCLNNSVHRERHILPSIEHLFGSNQGGHVFSKLDAKQRLPPNSSSGTALKHLPPSLLLLAHIAIVVYHSGSPRLLKFSKKDDLKYSAQYQVPSARWTTSLSSKPIQ